MKDGSPSCVRLIWRVSTSHRELLCTSVLQNVIAEVQCTHWKMSFWKCRSFMAFSAVDRDGISIVRTVGCVVCNFKCIQETRRGDTMGRLYLIQLDGRIYSCRHCRSHLAQCDELVSKVWKSISWVLRSLLYYNSPGLDICNFDIWFSSLLRYKFECFRLTHVIWNLLFHVFIVSFALFAVISLSARESLPF